LMAPLAMFLLSNLGLTLASV